MIVFSPAEPAKGYINVFTDITCGYCRKLHLEMDDLNRRGVEVRYLAFPRGVSSQTVRVSWRQRGARATESRR